MNAQEELLALCQTATNIYMTGTFIEAVDNFGIAKQGRNEGVWLDFFQATISDRAGVDQKKSQDFTTNLNGYRYRCCLAASNDGWGISMRLLPLNVPRLREDLQLDWNTIEPLLRGTGLTLFAGQMNSGKSTTLYSAIDRMDKRERGPITTIDDPTEIILRGPGVIQREVGTHVETFPQAIRDCMRQFRKTIVISEIRDPETAAAAILAASTGHSVCGTIHADSATEIVPRMLTLLDPKYARLLPGTLRGLWWQHVVRFGDAARKPVPIYESIEVTSAVRQILEAGPTRYPLLAQEMKSQGRKTMQECASALVSRGTVKREEVAEFLFRRGRVHDI